MSLSDTNQVKQTTNSTQPRRILVVDDEDSIRRLLKMILEDEGYEVFSTDDGNEALEDTDKNDCCLVIQDLRMPKMDGLAFLKSFKEKKPGVPVIVLTAFGTWETAVEAMRLGAYTHLSKPFDNDELRFLVSRALEGNGATSRKGTSVIPDLVGATGIMDEIARLIRRIAPTNSTVLITGESGTGKELVANAIHRCSQRNQNPFLAVNCGAFTETLLESELFGHVKGAFTNAVSDRKGVFESADRGTLFLDEVGEMSQVMQVKLLRVLETRSFRPVGGSKDTRVDDRIIAATNRNLEHCVKNGEFREDLFYRLNVIPIHLPPLRERLEDIPLLAGHFLARFAKRMNKPVSSIEEAVMKRLAAYNWPGNIRELENTIERAVALTHGDKITQADITGPLTEAVKKIQVPSSPSTASEGEVQSESQQPFQTSQKSQGKLPPEGMDLESHLAEQEKALIEQALQRTGWNITDASKLLGMSFRSLRYRLAKLKIERPQK